jgi:hypothetical protein
VGRKVVAACHWVDGALLARELAASSQSNTAEQTDYSFHYHL